MVSRSAPYLKGHGANLECVSFVYKLACKKCPEDAAYQSDLAVKKEALLLDDVEPSVLSGRGVEM